MNIPFGMLFNLLHLPGLSILFGMEKQPHQKRNKSKKLSRDEWLSRALEVLSQKGSTKLRIDPLTESLGVTKGSFYWHFEDRADFVKSLAEYWAQYSTEQVIEMVNTTKGSASDRLLKLMEFVCLRDLGKYDVPIRSWATQEPAVARIVKKVDEQRLAFVRSLFSELGFKGKELDMRSRTLAVFLSFEFGSFAGGTKRARLDLLKRTHAFFTGL